MTILYSGISFRDEDISEFFTLMTPDECIKNGQQVLLEDPNTKIQVEGSKEAEDQIFSGTNKTARGMHILCAGLSTNIVQGTTGLIGMEIKTDVCYVKYNKTLANYLAMDGDLNNPSEKTERIINEIYKRSCTFNKKSDRLVSVKVVEQDHHCYFQDLSSEASYKKVTDIVGYIAITLASLGIVGNGVRLSVHLSTRCDKKQSVYFVTKGLSETFLLVCIILQVSCIFITDSTTVTTDYLHPILYQFSLFSRNWITVIIGIEKCLVVWAPFFARAHFTRGLEIKLSLITVGIAAIFTAIDFLTKHFISYLTSIIDTDNLFIGGEIKMPIYSVVIHSLLPWVIVVISSVVAALGIRLSRKKRDELRNRSTIKRAKPSIRMGKESKEPEENDNGNPTAPVLLCLLAFIVSSVPVVVYVISINIGDTVVEVFLSYKATLVIGMVSVFFAIIGYSMDFYVLLAGRAEFREQLKENLFSLKNICL